MSLPTPQYELYQQRGPRRRWRWRLRAVNGEIVSQSSEAYRDQTDAHRAAEQAARTSYAAVVRVDL